MKLALIPPVQLLNYTEQTNTQLMLPHLLRNSKYAEHYKNLCSFPDQYVIMDNGAAEGSQFDAHQLCIIANEFQVDELVLPDVMGDWPATAGLGIQFLDQYDDFGLSLDVKLGVVAQGRNGKEAFECVREVVSHRPGDIEVIYIPRLLVTPDDLMIRLTLAKEMNRYFADNYEIHLLGASRHFPNELQIAAQYGDIIRSMDTSMPFVYGRYQYRVTGEAAQVIAPPHREKDDDYFFRIWSATEELYAQYNVMDMLSWARGS